MTVHDPSSFLPHLLLDAVTPFLSPFLWPLAETFFSVTRTGAKQTPGEEEIDTKAITSIQKMTGVQVRHGG